MSQVETTVMSQVETRTVMSQVETRTVMSQVEEDCDEPG